MYKVVLRFQDKVIGEFPVMKDTITIGRKSENDIRIDNLAVSGEHARIVQEGGKFFVEDLESLNGTFVDGAKITKTELFNNTEVMIGKHMLVFEEQEAPSQVNVAPDSYEKTMVLDTKQHKEMIAAENAPPAEMYTGQRQNAPAAPSKPHPAPEPATPKPTNASQRPARPQQKPAPTAPSSAPPAAKGETAILSVIDGKAEGTDFPVSGQRTTIGKGQMAHVKIKGLFAPAVAAHIYRSKDGLVLGPPDSGKMPKLNGVQVTNFTRVKDGDVIEAGGVTFRLSIKRSGK